MAPKLHPPPQPTPRLHQWRGFLVCGNFSSFTAPSQRWSPVPILLSLFFLFFFCPTQVRGDFLAFWEVWGLLPAFSRCSVGVVPHVDVFLMYLWGGRWSPRLTPLPSCRFPPLHTFLIWPSACDAEPRKGSSVVTREKKNQETGSLDEFTNLSVHEMSFICLSNFFHHCWQQCVCTIHSFIQPCLLGAYYLLTLHTPLRHFLMVMW